jgi:hypothetical protein
MFKSWGMPRRRPLTDIEILGGVAIAFAIIFAYATLTAKRAPMPCAIFAYVEHAGDSTRFVVACKGYVKLVPVDASTIAIRKDSLKLSPEALAEWNFFHIPK